MTRFWNNLHRRLNNSLIQPLLTVCINPGKSEVMYIQNVGVRCNDFFFWFYKFAIGFWNCCESVVHFVFILFI